MPTPSLPRDTVIDILNALGQPIRFRIVELLLANSGAPMSVNDIAQALQIPQNSTSTNLAILLRAEIVAMTPRGKQRLYAINHVRFDALLRALATTFAPPHQSSDLA